MKNNFNFLLHLIFIVLLIVTVKMYPQNESRLIEKKGRITFQSSQNTYINFTNTEGIKEGDTLFVKQKNKLLPVIIVKYLSATSCAGENTSLLKLIGDEVIIAFINEKIVDAIKEIDLKSVEIKSDSMKAENIPQVKISNSKKYIPEKNYYGRFSIQSISSLANTGSADDVQRWRYSFSFNKTEFLDPKLSFSSYIIFAYSANKWSEVKSNINNSLKIYDLTLSYKPDNKTTFWLGRHLNSKIGNIGASDGMQVERQLGDFYAGLFIGSRPNYTDYSYNIKLFEYGGYLGRSDKIDDGHMENVIGAFQQTNSMKTDRRFLYFQHSNTLISRTNFFFSTEVDLYKKENNNGKSTFSLTSFYLSLRVAPSRLISFSTSYDARRNVIYYETYKFLIDTLFQNELRQGLRFSTNIRPTNNLFVGLNTGYRFKSGDMKPSKNYGGYISYSNLPLLGITPSFNFTKIISSYVDGTDVGGKLSKYLSDGINFSVGYRRLTYQYTSISNQIEQNIIASDISILLFKNLNLSINYEGVFEKANTYSRFFIDLTTRF